jgi:hypothetical protein
MVDDRVNPLTQPSKSQGVLPFSVIPRRTFMAAENLRSALKTTIDRIRQSAKHFDHKTPLEDAIAYGTLSSVQMPSLPQSIADIPCCPSKIPEDADVFDDLKHCVETLREIADVVRDDEKVELSNRLIDEADRIEKYVIDPCQVHSPTG